MNFAHKGKKRNQVSHDSTRIGGADVGIRGVSFRRGIQMLTARARDAERDAVSGLQAQRGTKALFLSLVSGMTPATVWLRVVGLPLFACR